MNTKTKITVTALALLSTAGWGITAAASWVLDEDSSRLSFVSTKKEHIAEVSSFKTLTGSIDLDGNARLVVDLNTVDTRIAIRDERIRKSLFEIDSYPQAIYTVHLDPGKLTAALAAESGSQTGMLLEGTLDLHGVKHALPASVFVTKTGPNSILVSSSYPVIVNIADFKLVAGVDKLQEIAKLPHISHSVPISFHLVFHPK